MKILITTDWYTPAVNGVVRSVTLLRRELLAQGHEVRVLTLSQNRRSYEEDGVFYLASVGADWVYPGARIRLPGTGRWLKKLAEWGPEVIHSQCEFSTFGPAVQLACRCGCPLVHTYHTVYEDYTHYFCPSARLGRAAVRWFTRRIAKRCEALIAPTEKVQALLASYGIRKPIFTIPTGVDLAAFSPARDGTGLRAALRLPDDAPVLVCIGRLAAEKNHAELLRNLAAEQAVKPYLVFVGDGPARAELERLTEQLRLGGQVRFAGMVSPQEVARYYAVGNLFVSASQSETQGLTYLEAMACGLPLLCKADPCLNGLLADGQNGWQWHSAEEFCDTLQAYASSSALQAQLAQGALQTAARYSGPGFAASVLECYRQTANALAPMEAPLPHGGMLCSAAGFAACCAAGLWAWNAGLLTDLETLQAWINQFGRMGPLLFTVFQAVQVVVPVLPGGLGCLAGVLLFGPQAGFVYNYLGICVGSLAAFGIARQCGKPLLRRLFPRHLLEQYTLRTAQQSHFARWFALAIFLPMAPDDFLCYLAGTTAMGWRQFTAIIFACKPFGIAAYSFGLTVLWQQLSGLIF